jgi:hypothetical protein
LGYNGIQYHKKMVINGDLNGDYPKKYPLLFFRSQGLQIFGDLHHGITGFTSWDHGIDDLPSKPGGPWIAMLDYQSPN